MVDQLEAYLRAQSSRAFGDLASVSGRTLQPISIGLMTAADNLLAKALRDWRSDRARAMRYVDLAASCPSTTMSSTSPCLPLRG